MNRTIFLSLLLLVLPVSANAYKIPELEYWKIYELHLINTARQEFDLPLVGLDEEISEMSQAHAADSAMHFDDTSYLTRRSSYIIHDSSDGSTFSTRVKEFDIDGLKAAGENVGFRHRGPMTDFHEMIKDSLDLMHAGMMAEVPPDDGHRKTILGDYTHVGIGLEFHKPLTEELNTIFLVTDFGKFHEERIVRIPELLNPPQPLLRSTLLAPPTTITRKSEYNRRVKLRTSAPQNHGTTPPQSNVLPATWAERNSTRLKTAKDERSAKMLLRREERKNLRLRRMQ